MYPKILVLAFFYIITTSSFANDRQEFPVIEQRLNRKAVSIIEFNRDEDRLEQSRKVYNLFRETLEKKGSFDYPFDSLETISILKSPDEKFRIITWYVPLTSGHFKNYGFIQVRDVNNDSSTLYELVDKSMDISEPEFKTLDYDNWFGAYYYEMIYKSYDGKDYYTLLGWRGNNPLIRQRVIEPVRINSEGIPLFGKEVFKYKDNQHKRVIFSYSARVSMALKSDIMHQEESRRRRSSNEKLIVFDRLFPVSESLKGHYQFYKPEMNIFDGFVFEKGKWAFLPDIDVRVPGSDVSEPRRLQELLENGR